MICLGSSTLSRVQQVDKQINRMATAEVYTAAAQHCVVKTLHMFCLIPYTQFTFDFIDKHNCLEVCVLMCTLQIL